MILIYCKTMSLFCNKWSSISGYIQYNFLWSLFIIISGIRIRSDPLIFGLPDPNPFLFSPDPDPNYMKYIIFIFILNKYEPESTNSSYNDWLTKYFHSWEFFNKSETSYWWTFLIFHFELRSDLDPDPIYFSAEPDPEKKISDAHLLI